VFSGRLSEFPTTLDDGVDVGRSWAPGETHAFRFEITLSGRPAAMGPSAGADFRWEAGQG
jgi:hypothetical protein